MTNESGCTARSWPEGPQTPGSPARLPSPPQGTEPRAVRAGAGPDAVRAKRPYDLEERLIELALLVIEVVESLPNTRVGNHVAGQLIRCGTSPAANHGEAQSAEFRNDFIHKFGVVLKELRETRVWLRIVTMRNLSSAPNIVAEALGETGELIAIFARSIGTARKNQERPHPRRRV